MGVLWRNASTLESCETYECEKLRSFHHPAQDIQILKFPVDVPEQTQEVLFSDL